MTVQKLNTLHTICELERNQLLTILAMPIQNPQVAGPHFVSPLCKADRCFDRIPIHFKDTLMYVDAITRQTYDYATPITCDKIPRNIIELGPDSDDQDFYILGPEPIKRKPPLMFTPSQIKLQYALTLLVCILMQNLINFRIVFYFLNILTLQFNCLVKPLVILLFHLILLVRMQILLTILVIPTIHSYWTT